MKFGCGGIAAFCMLLECIFMICGIEGLFNACLVRIWACSQFVFGFGSGFRGVWSSGFGVLAVGVHGFGRRV